MQFKPCLVQPKAISSCPSTCYLGEETKPHLTTSSFQVPIESNKVSPECHFFSFSHVLWESSPNLCVRGVPEPFYLTVFHMS